MQLVCLVFLFYVFTFPLQMLASASFRTEQSSAEPQAVHIISIQHTSLQENLSAKLF